MVGDDGEHGSLANLFCRRSALRLEARPRRRGVDDADSSLRAVRVSGSKGRFPACCENSFTFAPREFTLKGGCSSVLFPGSPRFKRRGGGGVRRG